MAGARAIADAVKRAVATAAVTLRPDVADALLAAVESEPSERARRVLSQLLENAEIASRDRVPLCQDTGTVWVWIELGADECPPEGLHAAVNDAVAEAYRENALRMSVVRDALFDRTNTGDNTPAFVDVTTRPGAGRPST